MNFLSCRCHKTGACAWSVIALEAVEADDQPDNPVGEPDAHPHPEGLTLPFPRRHRHRTPAHGLLQARAQFRGEAGVVDEHIRFARKARPERTAMGRTAHGTGPSDPRNLAVRLARTGA